MKKYYNPEMTITNFYEEAVATTASSALAKWRDDESSASRSTGNVKFSEMEIVDISY